MEILTAGHKYSLANFEDTSKPGQTIQFIEKKPKEPGSVELVTVNDGTTNEEVLEMLINRLQFLNEKFPSNENVKASDHLKNALTLMNKRTEDRRARGVEGKAVA